MVDVNRSHQLSAFQYPQIDPLVVQHPSHEHTERIDTSHEAASSDVSPAVAHAHQHSHHEWQGPVRVAETAALRAEG